MKTKRNKKNVTNKRKKNKKLINKSFKKYRNNNKNFSRKYRQKGGVVGVYDKFKLNVKDITGCINGTTQILYNPKTDDYDSKLSIKFNFNPNFNCIDTLKYYNTAKLSFTQLKSYLHFYKIYVENFGNEKTLTLCLLGYLFIFCYLNNNKTTRDSTIIERLFRSVNPFVLETFVTKNPENNFFWNYFYKYLTLGNVGIGNSFLRSQRSEIYATIYPRYISFITIKDPHQLVSIFSDYRPYCSPFKYIGNSNNNYFNDNIRLYTSDDLIEKYVGIQQVPNLFKINNLKNMDTLFNNYQFVRELSNIKLLSDTDLKDNSINTKWDLVFDIIFNDDYLDVIRSMYNTDLSEELSSFFRDAFLRTMEELYIEQNGSIYPTIVPDKDNVQSIYDFLLLLSGLINNENYNFQSFKNEFEQNKDSLSVDIVRQILINTNFSQENVTLCLRNLKIYIKMYVLSKYQYTDVCLSIKKQMNTIKLDKYDVYGVFHSYSNGNNVSNTAMSIRNKDDFISNHKDIIIRIINNFVRTCSNNKITNYAKDKGDNTVFCANLFYDIIGNEYSEHKSYGVNLQQLSCQGTDEYISIAYIIQVSICSINSDGGIQSFELKYLLIWNNKDDVVYKEIDYIDNELTENFRNCFLKPIFTRLSNPIDVQRVNIAPIPGSNPGFKTSETFTNILSRKKNENTVPIDYDQSTIQDIDDDVTKLPQNNPPIVSINQNPGQIVGEYTKNSLGHIEVGGKKHRTKKKRRKYKK